MAHNATPHTTTKLAAIQSFLPDISNTTPISKEILNRDLQVAQCDQLPKFQNKSYADKHRGVKERLISVGDTVIIKQHKQKKLTPKFNPNHLTVSKVNGSQIALKGEDGSTFRRNISHVKVVKAHHVNKPVIKQETDDVVYSQPRRSMQEKRMPEYFYALSSWYNK